MKKLIISLALLSSFLIGNNVCAAPMAFIVNEGSNDVFEIQYRPLLQGRDSATIEIPSNDPDSPLTIISVSGEGI
jgi:hypothetical protein